MIVDFQHFEPPSSPNWFLACPPGWEQPACGMRSPAYEIDVEGLGKRFVAMVEERPRSRLVRLDPEAMQAEFEQSSAVFGFVDVIVVEFVTLGEERSSLAVYSRSRTGYFDFGVNERRVKEWLGALTQSLR